MPRRIAPLHGERVGVRGYTLSVGNTPSPGMLSHSDLSPWERRAERWPHGMVHITGILLGSRLRGNDKKG